MEKINVPLRHDHSISDLGLCVPDGIGRIDMGDLGFHRHDGFVCGDAGNQADLISPFVDIH
jgi:hypothetical protein